MEAHHRTISTTNQQPLVRLQQPVIVNSLKVTPRALTIPGKERRPLVFLVPIVHADPSNRSFASHAPRYARGSQSNKKSTSTPIG
jgi:hypothetical protein